MSWFSEIAGKAEDLLNRVDQTAATALQKQSNKPHSNSSSPYRKPTPESSVSSAASAYSTPRRTVSSAPPSVRKPAYNNSSGALKKKQPESDDEKLLKFLNESSSNEQPQRVKPKSSKSEASPVKMADLVSEVPVEKVVSLEKEKVSTEPASSEEVIETDAPDSVAPPKEIQVQAAASYEKVVPAKETETLLTSGAENESSLSSELSNDRAQHAEGELKRMQKKLNHWNSQISGNDKVVRELKDREKDMLAAIDAKDSQLAILKVRLQEADQQLSMKRNLVRDLEMENDRMIKEHAQSASLQNKTIEVMQEQLQKVEAELNKTQELLRQNQNEHMQKVSRMEEEHHHLSDSYSSLQKKWTELNERTKDLSLQLKQSNGNLEALQQEYSDYKQKAQRILQSKEKLISSLKEGSLTEPDSLEAASSLLEAESARHERDLIRDELRRANELAETYRAELQELEKMAQSDAAAAQERCRVSQEQLGVERARKEEVQMLCGQLKEELQALREDLTRTKTGFQSRIQDREIEIDKLRRQLTAKSLSSVSQDELESRLHALTENLIQKQTLVEALSTEKNSLVLQRERLEQQLREAQNFGIQQHTYVGINNNETVSERKAKAVFLDNPFDSPLTRRVKRVYGTIDKFSIRLGVFFRRYPITRVFVIVYMLLLHLWVMIVLLTYEPEVHNSGYEVPKSQ